MKKDLFCVNTAADLITDDAPVRVSKHGLGRTMERADMNEKQAQRFIRNAWKRGKAPDQLETKHQREYISNFMSILVDGVTELRVYNRYLFIFSATGSLITMYSLPRSFYRFRQYDENKMPVRSTRNYYRHYKSEQNTKAVTCFHLNDILATCKEQLAA